MKFLFNWLEAFGSGSQAMEMPESHLNPMLTTWCRTNIFIIAAHALSVLFERYVVRTGPSYVKRC